MVYRATAVLLSVALAGQAVHGLKVSAEEGVWAAPDLSMVNTALASVLAEKHLGPEQRKLAEHVADEVKRDIADVVSGKGLTKEQKRAKVKDALKEIGDLQDTLEKLPHPSNHTTTLQTRLDAMEKELAKKKSELAREQDEMKLLSLEKELDVKKMELARLQERKDNSGAGKAAAADAKQRDMVAKLLAMAKGLATSKQAGTAKAGGAKASKLAGISAMLEEHAKTVKASLDTMDAAYKKVTAQIDAMAKKSAKPQVLKMLEKKEHRKYVKARAVQAAELAELTAAMQSIKQGDGKALGKIMNKMQGEAQTLKANTNFLH